MLACDTVLRASRYILPGGLSRLKRLVSLDGMRVGPRPKLVHVRAPGLSGTGIGKPWDHCIHTA